jgi:hypothetical protein
MTPPLPKLKTYAYADVLPYAAMTRVFLVLTGIATVACMVATLLQWELFTQGAFTEQEGEASDKLMWTTGILRLIAYAIAGICLIAWTYRAHVNARSQGVFGLTLEPGLYAFSYLIPFVNFWLPFQGMKELWTHCFAVAGAKPSGTPALLVAWWTTWLLTSFLGVYVSKILKVVDLPSGIYASQMNLVWLACSLAAGILLWVIVGRISAHQVERQAQARATATESVAANR